MTATKQLYTVVEVWADEVPAEILDLLIYDDEYVYRICFDDLLIYHGDESGWCVDDRIIDKVEPWLEEQRRGLGIPEANAFWLRVKRA